ncbi:nucleotidyltransferase family protein [Eubacterium sp. MSJ-13]|uniref:nucleotidyltransferase family protein n=1 Tax=Eubacterium sp. MSJ-13 TaxID=2841513 RepID=UPI0020A106DE|nr:nucleotidyltransferase domain-containing protein [Eubacterium sp. MSJ-13]
MKKIEVQEFDTNTMPVQDVIMKVTKICKKLGVEHLELFGSFATGTALPTSDIDFVVYGKVDQFRMEDELEKIETLRNIDIFYFDEIRNEYLKEDIKKYGKRIY